MRRNRCSNFFWQIPDAPVDWSACGQLHTAVVQVLLAARPPMEGNPGTPFLRRGSLRIIRMPMRKLIFSHIYDVLP